MHPHQIDTAAHGVLHKAEELHLDQLERCDGRLLYRDNRRGVVRLDVAERRVGCAHQLHRVLNHLLDERHDLCRDIRRLKRRDNRLGRIAAHADRLSHIRCVPVGETGHVVDDLGECHMLDALDVHRVQLVDRDLIGNRLGERRGTVIAVLDALPRHVGHRIPAVRHHDLGHDDLRLGGLEKRNAVLNALHAEQDGHHVVVLGLHPGKPRLLAAVRADALGILFGHAAPDRLPSDLLDRTAHRENQIRLALDIVHGRIAEENIRALDQIHTDIALHALTALAVGIKPQVKTAVAVHTRVAQHVAVFGLHAGPLNHARERPVERHLRPLVFIPAERLCRHGDVVRDNHRDKQIDHAPQDVEDQRIQTGYVQSLPLSAEKEILIRPHLIVQTDPVVVIHPAPVFLPYRLGGRLIPFHPSSPFPGWCTRASPQCRGSAHRLRSSRPPCPCLSFCAGAASADRLPRGHRTRSTAHCTDSKVHIPSTRLLSVRRRTETHPSPPRAHRPAPRIPPHGSSP